MDQDADDVANDSTWDTTFGYNMAGRRSVETDVAGGQTITRLFDNQSLTGHSQVLVEDAPGTADDRYHAFADRLLAQSTGGDGFVAPLLIDGHSGVRALLDRSGGLVEGYGYDAHGTLLGTLDAADAMSLHLSDAERWDASAGGYDHRTRTIPAGAGSLEPDRLLPAGSRGAVGREPAQLRGRGCDQRG